MTVIYTILSKYLAGEATPEEAEASETWINASAENKAIFNRLLTIMELPSGGGNYQLPDAKRDWHTLKGKLSGRGWLLKILIAMLAAAILLIVLFLWQRAPQKKAVQAITIYSKNSSIADTLPGGTLVYLDKNSRMTRPVQAAPGSLITIDGAAYISKQQEVSSIKIKAGAFEAEAQGARFYISFDSVQQVSALHVQSGIVLVKQDDQSVQLQAGEAVQYRPGKALQKIQINQNLFSFATGILDFRDTPLQEAAAAVESLYHISVIIKEPSIAGCRITSLFDNKPLQEVLDIMAYTLNLEYEYQRDSTRILFYGKGCQ
jgi:transmembrane sensor